MHTTTTTTTPSVAEDHWERLQTSLEQAIVVTKDMKNKAELVDALDRLSDEIKSLPPPPPSPSSPAARSGGGQDDAPIVPFLPTRLFLRMVRSFHTLLQSDFWSFRQVVAFLLVHLFEHMGQRGCTRLLVQEQEGAALLQQILHNVTNTKREVRDAMAQCLGALSAVLGNTMFDEQRYRVQHFIFEDVVKKRPSEGYQMMEGLMVMAGYITCKCRDVSLGNWAAMCALLLDNAANTQFGSYSNYVRLQAVKALHRILQAPRTRQLMSEQVASERDVQLLKDTLQRIEKVTVKRLADADINVRRAASFLHNALFEGRAQSSPEDKVRIVNEMAHELMEQLDRQAISWETRHGLCEVFFRASHSTEMVSLLERGTVSKIFQSLTENLKHSETDASAFAANAAAGKSLVQLFITLHKSHADTLSSDELSSMYLDTVQPNLLFMLLNGQPSLLDCVSTSVKSLIDSVPQTIRPHLKNVLYSLYKCKFHASFPIRSTTGVVFNKARSLLGVETETKFITDLTPGIITILSAEAVHEDYEVRDAIFKALEELFSTTEEEESQDTLTKIFAMLEKASTDTSGRFSEVPRSAAIRALASYIYHLTKNKRVGMSLVDHQIDAVLSLVSDLLQDDEPTIVKATLRVVHSLTSCWWEKIAGRRVAIASMVYVVAKLQDEELKYAALPVYVSLLGSIAKTFETETHTIYTIFHNLKGSFTLNDENDEEQREAVSAVLRDIAACDLSRQELSVEEWEEVLSHVAKGLLLEDNRESMAIQANCMLFLCSLTNCKSLSPAVQESTKIRALLKVILHLYLYLLCGKPTSEFDFSEDVDELGEEEENDHVVDMDQLEQLSKLDKNHKRKFSFTFVGRNKVIVDTIAHVIDMIPDKEFHKMYMNGVNVVLREHSSIEGVAPYVPCWVRSVTHLAGVRNIEHLLTPDNKLASLLSVANGSTVVDDAAAKTLYVQCISDGPDASPDTQKGLYLRAIARIVPRANPHNLIKDLSQFQCVPEEIDIESDDHAYSVEDIHYGYRFGVTIEETSPYFVANACTNVAIAYCTDDSTSEEDKRALITCAVDTIVDDKDEEEEEVHSAKLMLFYYSLLAIKKGDSASKQVFGNDVVQDALTKLVDEYLLESVTGDETDNLWAWRLLEVVAQVLSDVDADIVSSWGAKILALLDDDNWVRELSSQTTVAAFSACGHMISNPTYLQQLSDMIANEDIDEDKHYLVRVLSWLQESSTTKFTLPQPRAMSVKGNSTFSANQ